MPHQDRPGIAREDPLRSFGEVKKPERINYRTLSLSATACSAPRSSAPSRTTSARAAAQAPEAPRCDLRKCGVEVTQTEGAARDMGHIDLGCALRHIWFLVAAVASGPGVFDA